MYNNLIHIFESHFDFMIQQTSDIWMNSFFFALDDSTVALTSVGDGDAVVEGVDGRLLLLFPLVLVQHPLAEEGEQVEDEATADDQRDD